MKTFAPLLVDGIDLNANRGVFADTYGLEDCEAFVKAYGKTLNSTLDKQNNARFNLYMVTNRLIQLCKQQSTEQPDVILSGRCSVSDSKFIECKILGSDFNFDNCILIDCELSEATESRTFGDSYGA